MINSDIPCKVIPIRNGLLRRRIGTAPVEPGTMLYYLWHQPTGLYWHECFVDERYAIFLAARTFGPTSMSDVAQSWVADTKHCQHSHKKEQYNGDHSL